MRGDDRRRVSPAPDSDPLKAFEDLQDKLVLYLSAIGLPAVLVAMSRAAEFGWRRGLSTQVAAWAGVVLLMLLRGRLSFRGRTHGFLLLMMIYAAAGMVTWGLSGQGLLLLFALVVMATLLDGPRAGLAAALVSLGVVVAAGVGFMTGRLSLGPEAHTYNRSLLGWCTGVSTAAALMLAAVWSLGRLKSSWLGIIQNLRDREEEYASILRFSPDIIYRLDVDNRITFISDAVRRYGYDPAELLGRSLLDFVHPEERSAVGRRLQERRTGRRRTHNMEARLFEPPSTAATPRTASDPIQPVFLVSAEGLYESGRARSGFYLGTQGVARDITDYKDTYRELLREKILTETTINSLPGVFYLFTERARLVSWNRNLEAVTGYAPQDLREKHILDFFPDDEHDVVGEGFREALAVGGSRLEAHLLCKSGAAVPYLLSGTVLALDGQRYLVGMGIDITERKQAETTLAESESKYRILAENIEDIIWAMDLDFRFTYISPAVEKMLGWTPEDIHSRGLKGIVPEEIQKGIHENLAGIRAAGELGDDRSRAVTVEQTLTHRQGHPVWAEISVNYLRDPTGRPCGLLGVTRDITRRKQAQLEKEELQQKLERSRKMEALGLLAGGVAHDLNNILAGIINYPSLMLMKLPAESPLRDTLTRMQASGEKAAEIVQDLLTLARRGVRVKDILDMNQVIREHLTSAEYLHLQARHPGVRLEAELAPDLRLIEGSPLHLKKALMNLISNAFEAQPGGGSIKIQTWNGGRDASKGGHPDVESGAMVCLRIVDQGSGMAPDEVERIFEPFYTRKKMGPSGTGLGLAVVWGTVEDHRGTIRVNSVPGEGTSFDLFFPAMLPTRKVPPAPTLSESQEGGGGAPPAADQGREPAP